MSFTRVLVIGFVAFGLLLAGRAEVAAQTPDALPDDTRDIVYRYAKARQSRNPTGPVQLPAKPARYVRKNPPAPPPLAPAIATQPKPKPLPAAKPAPAPPAAQIAQLGITTWLLRPAQAKDNPQTRMMVKVEQEEDKEFTPVRVSADYTFKPGDRVRLSVETPRTGYLYIVDRELFTGATASEPFLIFPTLRTRGGNNLTNGGHLIDIPAVEEKPFLLNPSRPGQIGEVLTFILTEQPLELPPLEQKALTLPAATFAAWLLWETPLAQYELAGGTGRAWTVEEKNAADANAQLAANAPLPQTTYRATPPPGQPLVVHVMLRYAKN